MKIACISDTHLVYDYSDLPEADVLVHSGDLTFSGSKEQILKALEQLYAHKDKYSHIIYIAGNHDLFFESRPDFKNEVKRLFPELIYLQDSCVVIDGIKFYGSPITPEFFDWAFMKKRGKELKSHWKKIPNDVNVLITHGPPFSILDSVRGRNAGCEDLLDRIFTLKDLKLSVFGHIHPGYGQTTVNGKTFVNAALLNDRYEKINKPIVIEI